MAELVAVQRTSHTAICTLNLAHKRNPISPEMRQALTSALDTLAQEAAIRTVIITGAGSAFCSGLDLEGLAAQSALSQDEQRADSESVAKFFNTIAHYSKPTIAAVNGPAVAGGCGLALLCDITVMSADAFLCFSEVKIGFVPALVGVYLERLVGNKISRELLLTARKVSAEEALAKGLVNAVVPAAELQDRANRIANDLAMNSPTALSATKLLLSRAAELDLPEALNLAIDINARARATSECKEGVEAFLQKRPPSWTQSV